MILRPQPLGNPMAVFLKVDALFDRIRWEPRSVEYDKLEVGGKLFLGRPRKVSIADAPMNKNKTLHLPQRTRDDSPPPSGRGFPA